MKFSQRIGKNSVNIDIQIDDISIELRNSLWNILTIYYWEDRYHSRRENEYRQNIKIIWHKILKKRIDHLNDITCSQMHEILSEHYFRSKWYDVYDFIEGVASISKSNHEKNNGFIKSCNNVLENENSAYRFVNKKIVEIASNEEISEIENAINNSVPFYGVKQHLSHAITLMSDKKKPDYRNSIKESISAIESLCKNISDNESNKFRHAINALEQRGIIHGSLNSAYKSLYGYTSNSDGIRHAIMDKSNLNVADARYMLVICSAFVNYVISNINSVQQESPS